MHFDSLAFTTTVERVMTAHKSDEEAAAGGGGLVPTQVSLALPAVPHPRAFRLSSGSISGVDLLTVTAESSTGLPLGGGGGGGGSSNSDESEDVMAKVVFKQEILVAAPLSLEPRDRVHLYSHPANSAKVVVRRELSNATVFPPPYGNGLLQPVSISEEPVVGFKLVHAVESEADFILLSPGVGAGRGTRKTGTSQLTVSDSTLVGSEPAAVEVAVRDIATNPTGTSF